MSTSNPSNSYLTDEIHSIQKELQGLKDDCEAETRRYHEQLRKLEDEHNTRLRRLHERQVDLARTLNSKQALTKDLPPETMSLIFQEACAGWEGSKVLLAIGRVSTHWRQIAWSTPQLWMRVNVKVLPSTFPYILSFLRLHLNNVKGLSLSLCLRFPETRSFAVGLSDALMKLLSDRKNARRIRSLSLHEPPQPLLSNALRFFSHLEDLDISVRKPLKLSLVGLSYLHNVTLRGVDPVVVEPSFPAVASLYLHNIPSNKTLPLFLRCPNAVRVYNWEVRSPVTRMDWEEIADIITFRCLEHITWVFTSDPTSLSLFRRIHAPCLESFECQYDDGTLEDSALWSFADSFPPSLIHLNLLPASWPPGFFERVFARTIRLETLEIEDFDSGAINMMSALHSGPGPDALFLPFLKELNIWDARLGCGDCIFDDELQWEICGFLGGRWRGGVTHFLLRVNLSIEWDPELKQEILSLVEAGFDLKIYEGGEIPSWLDLKC